MMGETRKSKYFYICLCYGGRSRPHPSFTSIHESPGTGPEVERWTDEGDDRGRFGERRKARLGGRTRNKDIETLKKKEG